nr:dicarboxylate/amino acid:cation symporter [uncultured Fluviicola sp.]
MEIDLNAKPAKPKPWYKALYFQVIVAIVAGVLLGYFNRDWGIDMKPLGDGFINLVKMMIAPLIFLTVSLGIAGMNDMKKVGKVAGKALLYFISFSTLALIIGLISSHLIQPGKGMNIDPKKLDTSKIDTYIESYKHEAETVDSQKLETVTSKAANSPEKAVKELATAKPVEKKDEHSFSKFMLDIIPKTFLGALTGESILQVLFVAILFGLGLAFTADKSQPVIDFLKVMTNPIFKIMSILMKLAPLGAFGAMAFTVGNFGIQVLWDLGKLVGTFYLTSAFFVIVVLGLVGRYNGFNIFKLLRYLKDELFLVFGTSSSEPAMPGLMTKMENAGCSSQVVGLVVPTGYSFNLDGTNIYMTLAALFIAQACNVELTWTQQITLLLVAMLSSKGAAGVTGAGFITLAATLAVVPDIPVEGIAIIYGVDKFMSECRALTNLIGNAVATIVVARWEKQLDPEALKKALK